MDMVLYWMQLKVIIRINGYIFSRFFFLIKFSFASLKVKNADSPLLNVGVTLT